MTTPESLALLLIYYDAPQVFGNLKCVAIDELHAFAGTKRGDLLALGLARLQSLSPTCRRRSEEHTSELQSLMRISYAVFCLKKKKTQNNNINLIARHYYKT